MSGLTTVTYAPVSTVTRHGLSPTQPYVTRPGSAFCVTTVTVYWMGFNLYACVLPFQPFSAGHRSFHEGWPFFLSASLLLLGRHSDFVDSHVSLGVLSLFPAPIVFYLHSIRTANPEVACLSTAPTYRSSCIFSPGEVRSAPPECPGAHFVWPGKMGATDAH
jgi:hypothetical protein